MRIAAIIGKWSTCLHGPLDVERLFQARALTGSESSFFHLVDGLCSFGHEVTVYCDVVKPVEKCERLKGATVKHVDETIPRGFDAYISLNEPDQLRRAEGDENATRILMMQINDLPFCAPGYKKHVDAYVCVSPVHMRHLVSENWMPQERTVWIPNSIDLMKFAGANLKNRLTRVPGSMVWCSSPDRGLHRLIEIYPKIKEQIPEATLKIFYRLDPWLESTKKSQDKLGARARYIDECLKRLGRDGENGITVMGPRPNIELIDELSKTEIMPYTCDPVSFTEGFSVSIMDALASGALPIISDADAIGDIYKDAATIINGKVGDNLDKWVETIVSTLKMDPEEKDKKRIKGRRFAARFHSQNVVGMWHSLIEKTKGIRKNPTVIIKGPCETIQQFAPIEEVPVESSPKTEQPQIESPKAPAIIKRGPKISVIVNTFRPGGLDLTFAGMAGQKLPKDDFEVIVIDKRYALRHDRVVTLAKQYGDFNLIHAPEHRINSKWVTFCSAWNTGMALARGHYLIFLQDYAYAPPGWIEAQVDPVAKNEKRYSIAPYDYLEHPPLKTKRPFDFSNQKPRGDRCTELDETLTGEIFDEIEVFEWGLFDPSWIGNLKLSPEWQECRGTMQELGKKLDETFVHIKNECLTRELAYKLNGLDERMERGKGPMDIDFGIRVINSGAELYWNELRGAWHSNINPRVFCRNHPWGSMTERLEGRWSYNDGLAYNELQKKRGAFYAQNLYDLNGLAQDLEPWREPGAVRVSRDISDIAYWRREIWPDTPLDRFPPESKK